MLYLFYISHKDAHKTFLKLNVRDVIEMVQML